MSVYFLLAFFSLLLLACKTLEASNNVNALLCPGEGWFPYSNLKCFKLIKQYVRIANAIKMCGDSDGKLATIRTESEETFVNQLLNSSTNSPEEFYIWLDAQRVKEGGRTFIWKSDGSKVEHSIIDSEDDRNSDKCLITIIKSTQNNTVLNGTWFAWSCNVSNLLLCEKTQSILEYFQNKIEQLETQYTNELNSLRGELFQCPNYRCKINKP